MKKLALFLLLVLSAGLFAQTPVNTEPELARHKMQARQIIDQPVNVTANPVMLMPAKSNNKIAISSSANAYTLLVEETTCLTANQDLNAMMFTSRGNPAEGIGSGSGSIVVSYSTTTGYSWKSILATNDGKGNRYPGGVIYNPTGNTDINNAYAVVCGPTTDGSGWIENFWGSVKLDSTNQHVVYENKITYDQDFPRYGMAAPGSGKVHVLGDKYVFTSGVGITEWHYVTLNTGTFNATSNKFDWNRVNIYNTFANPALDLAYEVSSYSTAWSPDGSVGYVYILGIDSANPNTSYQPVVFKSTDFGATWNKLPFYDFSLNTTLNTNIWATLADPSVSRPFFSSQMEAVVDNNGELHMFGVITGAYSTHPDSLGYTFKYEPKNLYHVYTTPTGWEADLVSTIYTLTVDAAESGYGSGADAIGWDHRVQMARTADGTKIFGVWADSDTTFFPNVLAPNINVWGKNLTNNTTYPVTDFTTGTSNDGVCFFHYVSDIALETNGNIVIPVTITNIGLSPVNPVYHFYLPNVGYGPTIGLNEINNEAQLSIIGVHPNPVSEVANVRINLGQSSNVSVEVFTIAGQKVHRADFGQLAAGENQLQLNVDHLNSGMYVYVVTAGQQKASGKLLRH